MGESSDPRFDFIQDYTLKSLRLKPDKWSRMMVSDEQRTFITNFVERTYPQVKSKRCL
jgi:dynein heavy chain